MLRAGDWKQKDVSWPFKIVYVLDTQAKVHHFSTASEEDMKVRIIFFTDIFVFVLGLAVMQCSVISGCYSVS